MMDIDIFVLDDHPHRDSPHVTPEYLRHALNNLYHRILAMPSTPEFQQAVTDLVAAAEAHGTGNQAAIDAAVAAAQADDLKTVQDAQAALTPPA